ncbi:hypothetical protein GOP47_0020939 [Adiantum capillus-veneris]|uniref:Uncharacterized protein n=1 Tax=Adiantum capillus-veneris TaxID=13818 RepID=A0A9D4Z7F7_ADICA|nr:hypothetical protein GOP47_0020939 [Adiantum capillus-veneris]
MASTFLLLRCVPRVGRSDSTLSVLVLVQISLRCMSTQEALPAAMPAHEAHQTALFSILIITAATSPCTMRSRDAICCPCRCASTEPEHAPIAVGQPRPHPDARALAHAGFGFGFNFGSAQAMLPVSQLLRLLLRLYAHAWLHLHASIKLLRQRTIMLRHAKQHSFPALRDLPYSKVWSQNNVDVEPSLYMHWIGRARFFTEAMSEQSVAGLSEDDGKVCVLVMPLVHPLPGLMQQLGERYTLLQIGELDAESSLTISALVSSGRGVDRSLLDSLPNLRIICSSSVGVDQIDLHLCHQRAIRVTNAAHVNVSADTADMAILLMLASLRCLCPAHHFVQSGSWRLSSFPLARKASGLRVGIVGLGQIGRAIAKRAVGLNSIVSYFGPTKKEDVAHAYYSDLIDLATNSDVLIVACLLSKDTRHLIGKDVLDGLGPMGVLVNIARGPVVDELELTKALAEKRLGAAGLDVFEREPYVPTELMSMDNVVLSPHAGAATLETRMAVTQLIVDNLDAFFTGKRLLTAVI